MPAHHFAPHRTPKVAMPFGTASAHAPAADPQALSQTRQRPVSVLGWALVFGGGAAIWAGLYALLT